MEHEKGTQAKILSGNLQTREFEDPRGLGRILYQNLLQHGNNVLQIDGTSGQEDTCSDYLSRCRRTAIHMKQQGFVPMDKVTICTYNTLNSSVPLIASLFLGVVPSAVDPSFSPDEFKYFLNLTKPKAIFVIPEVVDKIAECLTSLNMKSTIIVFGISDKYMSFNNLLVPAENEDLFEPYDAISCKDTALILFSSGTTAKPKGICLNHSYFLNIIKTSFFAKSDRILIYSSLFWMTQVSLTVANVILGFVKLVYPRYDGPDNFCKLVLKYKLQTAFLTPTYLIEVTEYCNNHKITLSLRHMLCGGSSLPKKHLVFAHEVFPNTKLLYFYGQTECGFITAYERSPRFTDLMKQKLLKGSSGKITRGKRVKIVDLTTGKLLGPFQEGEICVGGQGNMNSYYNVDSYDVIDSEGYIRTGDIGYYDEDEYIYVVDRCKEMLIYKSFHISPSFIEDILSHHPAVKQSIVAGIPHDIDGDHLIAFVLLKEGSNISPDEIQKFVDSRVDDRKKLRGGVKIITEIPLGATGKPNRRLLRDMVTSGQL